MAALAVLNAGRIEDVLGFSARAEVDPYRVWRRAWGSAAQYFDESQSLGNALLCLERLAFVAAWGYLLVQLAVAGQWKRRFPFFQVPGSKGAHTTCILSLWIAAPLAVFVAARLWTMLSYFLILYPAHFLVIGAARKR